MISPRERAQQRAWFEQRNAARQQRGVVRPTPLPSARYTPPQAEQSEGRYAASKSKLSNQSSGGGGFDFKGLMGNIGGAAVGALSHLDDPMRAVQASVFEPMLKGLDAGLSGGQGGVVYDEDRMEEADLGFMDKVFGNNEYGVGMMTRDTGNKWLDRAIGFTGDVATDPLTYITGAAGRSANVVGRLGREDMAYRLVQAGMPEAAESAGRYGVAYLDDAARQVVKVEKPGLYAGWGRKGVAIPGTETIGRGIERTAAQLRVNTISRVTNRANLALRTPDKYDAASMGFDLRTARRAINSGKTVDGVSPQRAAAMLNAVGESKRMAGRTAELLNSEIDDAIRAVPDERAAADITRQVQSKQMEPGGPAEAFRDFFARAHDKARKEGMDIGFVGDDEYGYVPLRNTDEGSKWLNDTEAGRQVSRVFNDADIRDPSFLQKRSLNGKAQKYKLPDGRVLDVPANATLDDINEAFAKIGAPKMFEDDIRKLTSSYIKEFSEGMGLRQAFSELVKTKGFAKAIDEFPTDELDEIASMSANKEASKALKSVVNTRVRAAKEAAEEARVIANEVRDHVVQSVDDGIAEVGDEHEILQKGLLDLKKDLRDADAGEDAVKARFDDMRKQVDEEYDRVAYEHAQIDETIAALEAQIADPIAMGTSETGRAVDLGATQRLAELNAARQNMADQLDGFTDAREAIAGLQAELVEFNAVKLQLEASMDSPDILEELATDFLPMEVTRTRRAVGPTTPENATPRANALKARLVRANDEATADALAMQRRAGDYEGVVEAYDLAVAEVDDRIVTLMAERQKALGQIADDPNADWVPLSLLAKKARLDEEFNQLMSQAGMAKRDQALKAAQQADDAPLARRALAEMALPEAEDASGNLYMDLDDIERRIAQLRTPQEAPTRQVTADVSERSNQIVGQVEEVARQQTAAENRRRSAMAMNAEKTYEDVYRQWSDSTVEVERLIREASVPVGPSDANRERVIGELAEATVRLAEADKQLKMLDKEILMSQSPAVRRAAALQDEISYQASKRRSLQSARKMNEKLAQKARNGGEPLLNDPRTIRELFDLTEKLERREALQRRTMKFVDELTMSNADVGSEEGLRAQLSMLQDLRARIEEVPEPVAMVGPVGQAEAVGFGKHVEELKAWQKKAQQKFKALENQRRKEYPTGARLHDKWLEARKSARAQGMDEVDAKAWADSVVGEESSHYGRFTSRQYSDVEMPQGGGTLTREEYLAQDPSNVMYTPHRTKTWTGYSDDADEFDEFGGAFAWTDDNVDDLTQNIDVPDEMLPGQSWDKQAEMLELGDGDTRLWELNEQIRLAKDERRQVNQAVKRTLRRYGMDDDQLRDVFYGGNWNEIIFLDMGPEGAAGAGKRFNWNSKRAVGVTKRELREMAVEAGVSPQDARKMRHGQLAKAVNGKAHVFKDGHSGRLLPVSQDQVDAFMEPVFNQLAETSGTARRMLRADARSAANEARNQALIERRMVDAAIRDTEQQLGAFDKARQSLAGYAQEAQDEVSGLQGRIDDIGAAEARVGAAEKAVAGDRAAFDASNVDPNDVVRQQIDQQVGRRATLETQAEALEVVADRLSPLQAKELMPVTVDRAVASIREGLQQTKIDAMAARGARLEKTKKAIPKKLKKSGADRRAVLKQTDELIALLKDAPNDPGSAVAADLMGRAQKARNTLQKTLDDEDYFTKLRKLAESGSKKNADERLTSIHRAATDGWLALESRMFPEGSGYLVPPDVKRALTNFKNTFDDEKPWLRLYDEANQFFKTYATMTPGFHMRNFMSATFMNMTESVTAKQHLDSFGMWRAYAKIAHKKGGATPAELNRWWDNLDDDWKDAFDAVFGSGTGGQYEAAELGRAFADGAWGKARKNRLTEFSRKVGVGVEGPVRLSLAKHYIDNGADAATAWRAVTRVHFDYTDVTKFDRGMKRLIPFWTFMSRNLPLQFEQMVKRPKAYRVYENFMSNFDQSEGDGEFMPQWMEDNGAIVAGRNMWPFGGGDLAVMPDLPHVRLKDEINQMAPNPLKMLSSASPFLRIPVELTTGYSAFYDDDLQVDGFGEGARYAAEGVLPPLGQIERLFNLNGRATGQGAANYVGIPVRALNDDVRAGERRRREWEERENG